MKRIIYALIMVALVALPTTSTALASGPDRSVQKTALRIEKTLDLIDAGIARIDTRIDRVDDRLAADLRERERQRLELERQRLEQQQTRLAQLRDGLLAFVCNIPSLQLIVPQCGWSE